MVQDETILGPIRDPAIYERMYYSLKNITSKWFYSKETVDTKLSNKINKSSTNGFVKNDGSIAGTIEARLITSSSETIPLIADEGNLGLNTNQVVINETIDDILEDINSDIDLMAHKSNGASEITDNSSNSYTNIGSMNSGATQKSINNKINIALGNKIENASESVSSANLTNNSVTLDKINSNVLENIDYAINDFIEDYYNINLVPGSKEYENVPNIANTSNGEFTGEYYHGYKVKRLYNPENSYMDHTYYLPQIGTFKGGDIYTISFWAKGINKVMPIYFHGDTNYIPVKPISWSSNVTPLDTETYGNGQVSCSLSTNWQKYSVTYELDPEGTNTNVQKRFVLRSRLNDVYICGVNICKENDASEYYAITHYSLPSKPDINNFEIGDELTINILLQNANNQPISNRSFRLYTYTDKGIFTSKNNGESLDGQDTNQAITIKTNSNGLATATFECTKSGLVTFSATSLTSTITNKDVQEIKLPHIFIEEYDSGWITPDLTNNQAFNHYNNNWPFQYRRIGKMVHIRGAVTPAQKLYNLDYDNGKQIVQLPSDCAPSHREASICSGTEMNKHLLQVYSDGKVYVGARYGSDSINRELDPGIWLHCDITYFVD